MHPVLFRIGPLPIHSYGLMLAVSFLFGIWLSSARAKKKGLDPNVISDVGFWIIIAAIVGARIYYVFLHFDEFAGNFGAVFNPFHGQTVGIGGLVMYGGLIGAVLAGTIYFKVKKAPFLPYADAIAPSVGFGIFLTRIGCFLNGCCFGGPAHGGVCAVSFPPESPAGHYQLSIHADHLIASQLIASAGGLVIGLTVLLIGRYRNLFTGFQFYLTIVLYSMLRFGVDFTRFYGEGEKIGGLSHNQIICIILFVLFGGLILRRMLFTGESSDKQSAHAEQNAD
jgi:phosphatidylglycerol:prolipoprotein diacylglycerol transferase